MITKTYFLEDNNAFKRKDDELFMGFVKRVSKENISSLTIIRKNITYHSYTYNESITLLSGFCPVTETKLNLGNKELKGGYK